MPPKHDWGYTVPRKAAKIDLPNPEIEIAGDDVLLSGTVKGKKASSTEEYFAMGADALGWAYFFQYEIYTATSLPGQPRQIDFILFRSPIGEAVEVDGPFHRVFGEQANDTFRDSQLREPLIRLGFKPSVRHIAGEFFTSREGAVAALRNLPHV